MPVRLNKRRNTATTRDFGFAILVEPISILDEAGVVIASVSEAPRRPTTALWAGLLSGVHLSSRQAASAPIVRVIPTRRTSRKRSWSIRASIRYRPPCNSKTLPAE